MGKRIYAIPTPKKRTQRTGGGIFIMSHSQRLQAWRRSLGICCICGQPIASPRSRRLDGLVVAEEDAGASLDSDGRLLTIETPVRLALMRFNALGETQAAHIVDAYTFLQQDTAVSRRKAVVAVGKGDMAAAFRAEFNRHYQTLLPAAPSALALFKAQVVDVPDAEVFRHALAAQRRAVEHLTVPACKRCNKAMDSTRAHTMATYRCFWLTRSADVPQLEASSNDALAARKVLQQVAFFFQFVPHESRWIAKDEPRLLRDAVLWRCVAHLCNWGASPAATRYRMIATFHAAHHLFLRDPLRAGLAFETWHRMFRVFLMQRYAPNTFFGLSPIEIGSLFDLSRKDGAEWERLLRHRLAVVGDEFELALQRTPRHHQHALRVEQELSDAGVADEEQLLRFLVARHAPAAAANAYLQFFAFNLKGGNPFFVRQCALLAGAVAVAARPAPPPPRASNSSSSWG